MTGTCGQIPVMKIIPTINFTTRKESTSSIGSKSTGQVDGTKILHSNTQSPT